MAYIKSFHQLKDEASAIRLLLAINYQLKLINLTPSMVKPNTLSAWLHFINHNPKFL